MPSFVLAQPRSSFASAIPAVTVHVALIVAAIGATQATLSGVIADPPVISIDWPVTTTARSMPTTADLHIPGAPIIGTPVITDLPTPGPVPVITGVPDPDPFRGILEPGPAFPAADTFSSAKVFPESEVDDLPSLLSPGRLRYPAVLADAGINGAVTLTFVIDAEGKVDPDAIEILSATHPGFVAAAKEAVSTSLFRPARKHGAAVRVRVRQTISFKH